MHNTGQLTIGFLSSSLTFKIRWFTSNSDHFIYFESNSDQIIYFESLNLLIIYTTLVCSRNSTFSILPNIKKKKNVLQNKLPKAHQCQVQMAVRPPTVRDSLHHPPIGTENWELTPCILLPNVYELYSVLKCRTSRVSGYSLFENNIQIHQNFFSHCIWFIGGENFTCKYTCWSLVSLDQEK